MARFFTIILLLASATPGLAEVVAYEANSVFPELANPVWERVGTFDATRDLSDEMLAIDVDLGVWAPPPYGEQDFYTRSLAEYQGAPFFVEWRCRSNAPCTEISGVGGSVINSTGSGVSYHFTITENLVRFRRDNSIPFVFVSITPGEFYSYRVEIYGAALYQVFLDGQVMDSGIPEGDFPNLSADIIWGASVYQASSVNEWDYIRYGTIPADESGDFDSDGDVDDEDLYFFQDCLLGPDADGPGCRWADMNGDGNADGADIRLFVDAMLAP